MKRENINQPVFARRGELRRDRQMNTDEENCFFRRRRINKLFSLRTWRLCARISPLCYLPALCLTLLLSGCVSREIIGREVMSSRLAHASKASEAEQSVTIEGIMTLEDALKLSLANNRDLLAARKQNDIARGRILESYSSALPNISADARYTRLDEVNSLNIGEQQVSMGFENNYSANLTVRQPLYRGGAISAALRSAQFYDILTDETIRAAVENLIFQTAKEYYDVLLAQQLVAVEEQAVKSAEAHLEDVKNKRRNGVASDYDVLRSEVEVSNLRAELIRQNNALSVGMTSLLKTMGVSQGADISLEDKLSYIPMKADMQEAINIARENRSDLYQAELSVKLQNESLLVAQSAYRPQLDANFTHEWGNPDPHSAMSDEWGSAWNVGFSLSLPIFDGLGRKGRVTQEKAKLEQALIKLSSAEETVELDVRQAVLNLRYAGEFAESQKMNLQRAEEGLRLVQAGYREGVNTEVEVSDANTALTRTRALYYQAIHAHVIARINLQRATGTLGPNPSVLSLPSNIEAEDAVKKILTEHDKTAGE